MAGSTNPKRADNHIPYCHDQGMPYLAGAHKAGVTVQSFQIAMPADGIIKFATVGLMDMANKSYQVFVHNHSDVADEATVANAARTESQITVTGPDSGDVLDIMIVGQVKGQLA